MTLEQKHDLLFPLACAVSAAIENFDDTDVRSPMYEHRFKTLCHMARELRKAVDYISPDPVSSASGDPK